MAVPKKRTSKAKKNKRKTAWIQKALTLSVSEQSRLLYAKTFTLEDGKTLDTNKIGFRPTLRFKYQPSDQLRSKRKHFMKSKERVKLLELAKSRLNFNPQSNEKRDEEVRKRCDETLLLQKQKQVRQFESQNKKKIAKEKKDKEAAEAQAKARAKARVNEENKS
jgi:hypothetical protein